ncbi:MAG: 3',5'-cyclic nucleotide phosphodiesterase [archaeon]|nr:3',5'-cyclic nucleotide phosphodiesterase [archaeon]
MNSLGKKRTNKPAANIYYKKYKDPTVNTSKEKNKPTVKPLGSKDFLQFFIKMNNTNSKSLLTSFNKEAGNKKGTTGKKTEENKKGNKNSTSKEKNNTFAVSYIKDSFNAGDPSYSFTNRNKINSQRCNTTSTKEIKTYEVKTAREKSNKKYIRPKLNTAGKAVKFQIPKQLRNCHSGGKKIKIKETKRINTEYISPLQSFSHLNIQASINKTNIQSNKIKNNHEKGEISTGKNSGIGTQITSNEFSDSTFSNLQKQILKVEQLNKENVELLKQIGSNDCDILEIQDKLGYDYVLLTVSLFIFNETDLLQKYFKTEIFKNFIQEISNGYFKTNPYHNAVHASDVLQTTYMFTKGSNIFNIFDCDAIDRISLFLSCAVHDYKHPGLNNNFLISTNDKIALMYNDQSVLESYHISQSFMLMHSNEKYNILSNFNKEEYKAIRRKMILNVLGTDMAFHSEKFEFIKKEMQILNPENIKKEQSNGEEREFDLNNYYPTIFNKMKEEKKFETFKDKCLSVILHAADISNPTKPKSVYDKISVNVMEEFWRQGDKEKDLGLPVSMSCDRKTVSINDGQFGFVKFIVVPFFNSLTSAFPGLKYASDNASDNLQGIIKEKEKSSVNKTNNNIQTDTEKKKE